MRVARVLFALMLGASLLLAARPLPRLADYPLEEDGYLALTVARQLGTGGGLSVDGETRTGGVQPLWVFAAAPLFAATGGDRVPALRLVTLLQASCYGAAGLLFVRLLLRLRPGSPLAAWGGGVLFLGAFEVWKTSFSGMESGCLLLAYLMVLHALVRLDPLRPRSAALLGALLGVLVLARVDAGFFAAALCGALALRAARSGRAWPGLRGAIVAALAAAAVTAPWWWYNVALTGSPMPQGGLATFAAAASPARLWPLLNGIARGFVPFLALLGRPAPVSAVLHLAAGAALLAVAAPRLRELVSAGGAALAAGAGAVSLAALGWAYLHSSAAWFYPRYFVWLAIPGCAVAALALERLAAGRPARLAAAGGVVLLLWGRMLAYPFVGGEGAHAGTVRSHPCLALAAEHVPAGELIGAGQSGVLGFFRDGVVNLDGKVNPAALARRGDLGAYLEETGVHWVCDDPRYLALLGFDAAAAGFRPAASLANVVLYRDGSPVTGPPHAGGRT